MASKFSISNIVRTGFDKARDFTSDVITGAGNIVNANSAADAWKTVKTGATATLDSNRDGNISPWEMAKATFTGIPTFISNTLANAGDPTRGQPAASVEGTKTGANISSSFPTVSLDKMPVQAMPVSGVAESPVSGVAAPISAQPKATTPATTISGIMGLGAGIAGAKPMTAQQIYSSAPIMTQAEKNAIANSAMVASAFSNPASRTVGSPSVSDRFDPLAGHKAFVKSLDMAKFSGELNPSAAYADDQFNKQMQQELAGKAQ